MGSGFLHGVKEQRLTAEQLAEAVAQLPVTGSGQIEVTGGRGGTAVGFKPGPVQVTDIRPCVVTNVGPKGEDDFESELYWVQVWRPAGGPAGASISILPDRANYSDDWWVPATNLPEWPTGGHALAVDGTELVIVFRLVDAGGNERFVFSRPPSFDVRFGSLATAWPEFADHNKVTLAPCVSAADDTPLADADGVPLPDVVAYIQTPLPSTPPWFAVDVGQIVAYVLDGGGNAICLHVPAPPGTELYDVMIATSAPDGKPVFAAADVFAK